MTPTKNKKPLPSTTSTASPESPETLQQWRVAIAQVRNLYLTGQWKYCSAQCDQLLQEGKTQPHPLHATYLHFYSAISSEALARLAHSLSPVKVQLLELAKDSYHAAASSLPLADTGHEYHDQCDADTRSTYSTRSDEGSDSWDHGSPKSRDPTDHKAPLTNTSPASSAGLGGISQAGTKLTPSTLRIRKISSFRDESMDSGDDEQSIPPCTRSQSPPPQPHRAPSDSTPTSLTISSSADYSWLQARSHLRYSNCLAAFAEMVATHISAVDTLIHKTRAVQSARYFTKRLASCGEDEESRAANLRFRIARLKASGWKMERFAPERYQELCARALAEL